MSDPQVPDELYLAIAAISRVDPEPIQDHWVDVGGVHYPPKQAFELACGQSRSTYNSHHALAQLRKIGFVTSVYQPRANPSIDRTTAPKTAEVEIAVGEEPSASFSTVVTSPTTDEVPTPGTWRTSDGSAVPFKEACASWATAAYDVLADTATRYNDFITYKELAEKVQDLTGIRTRSQMRNWIGGVLGEVAVECQRRREPALTALCVTQDQTVGRGYQYVLDIEGQPIPDDLDQHAARARLDCYRHFAAELPAGGGEPTLPPQVVAARESSARKSAAAVPPKPPAMCPRHHLTLPKSGICDDCA
ncbi:hypothetical protein [Rhodococcus sp. NPDC127528]|uniref:hypothetical protein n=1 Tax=unclassified Rhodococcus (in: high G+C Gram-positive bacteria) TaxID=192944 RepID=UPI003628F2B3